MKPQRSGYCSLATVEASIKAFIIPAMDGMREAGYQVTLGCTMTEQFKESVSGRFTCIELSLSRGFHLRQTVRTFFQLYRYFRKKRFLAVEYATENVSLPASVAAWCARVPVRIYNHWGILFIAHTGLRRTLAKWIEGITAHFSTDIRQVSTCNAEQCVLNHLYPAYKVRVLGKGGTIGVDTKIFDVTKKKEYAEWVRERYHIPADAFIFGYVGRIQAHKGINELIEAFRQILTQHSVYLMLVGNPDEANPITEQNAMFAETCDNIIMTGQVSDAYKYFAAFDVLTHPSYHEGFGMVLQEAAAMKTPIITTDIIGPKEFITNETDGILVQPRNMNELERAMRTMLEHENIRTLYAERAYQNVITNFERRVMVQRIVEDRKHLIEERVKISK